LIKPRAKTIPVIISGVYIFPSSRKRYHSCGYTPEAWANILRTHGSWLNQDLLIYSALVFWKTDRRRNIHFCCTHLRTAWGPDPRLTGELLFSNTKERGTDVREKKRVELRNEKKSKSVGLKRWVFLLEGFTLNARYIMQLREEKQTELS
jgi:hypothetical protein